MTPAEKLCSDIAEIMLRLHTGDIEAEQAAREITRRVTTPHS